jgi:hypothetical protein
MDRSSAFSSLDQFGKNKAWPNYGTLGQYRVPVPTVHKMPDQYSTDSSTGSLCVGEGECRSVEHGTGSQRL